MSAAGRSGPETFSIFRPLTNFANSPVSLARANQTSQRKLYAAGASGKRDPMLPAFRSVNNAMV